MEKPFLPYVIGIVANLWN